MTIIIDPATMTIVIATALESFVRDHCPFGLLPGPVFAMSLAVTVADCSASPTTARHPLQEDTP